MPGALSSSRKRHPRMRARPDRAVQPGPWRDAHRPSLAWFTAQPRREGLPGYISTYRRGNSLFALRYTTSSGELVISTSEQASDRRANLVLRALIDEMLERVRGLNANPSTLTTDERSRAEAELESIMARVRRYAALRDQQL